MKQANTRREKKRSDGIDAGEKKKKSNKKIKEFYRRKYCDCVREKIQRSERTEKNTKKKKKRRNCERRAQQLRKTFVKIYKVAT